MPGIQSAPPGPAPPRSGPELWQGGVSPHGAGMGNAIPGLFPPRARARACAVVGGRRSPVMAGEGGAPEAEGGRPGELPSSGAGADAGAGYGGPPSETLPAATPAPSPQGDRDRREGSKASYTR
ncbi:hypothetical protein NL676_034359 [Syzygium grande]|nr:hypothetical protein NL676_034359 [Syzygium grande]